MASSPDMPGWKEGLIMIAYITIGVLVVLAIIFIAIFNSLVGLRNQVKNAWSQIDVQLKRRWDLIPNLVETAKAYMTHERGTMEAITKARSGAMSAATPAEKGVAESLLSAAVGKFMVAVEAYPDLKASTNFLAVQEQLATTENKISFARQSYNDSVLSFNNKIEMFPSNIVAGMFNFKQAEMFVLDEPEAKNAPKVSFN